MQPNMALKLGVTLGALIVTAVHTWVPSIKVDTITLVLLSAAVIPWLQPIFKTIKLPGGFEVTLQELKQEIKTAAGAAQSAERKADLAVSGMANNPVAFPTNEATTAKQRLDTLARQYETVRSEQANGPARTQSMTAIVRQMIELASSSLEELDPVPLLRSTKMGDRLVGYAFLYAKPNPSKLSDLVHSVTAIEEKPFGQYWGLQAVGRNIGTDLGTKTADTVLQELMSFAARVPSGSDRDYELRKIIAQLRGSS